MKFLSKIWSFITVLILNAFCINQSEIKSENWIIDTAVKQIIGNKELYQVTIIKNDEFYGTAQEMQLFNKITSEFPVMSINILLQKNTVFDRLMKVPSYKNPRDVSIYVVFQNQNNETLFMKKLYNILDFIARLSPLAIRPKCLIIVFSSDTIESNDLKEIFHYSWVLKFLDFTVLEIRKDHNPMLMFHNPFTDIIYNIDFKSNTDLFPDKLQDVNEYPFKLSVTNFRPFLNVTRDSQGNIKSVNGLYFTIFEQFKKKLNIRFHFIDEGNISIPQFMNTQSKRFSANEVDMSSLPRTIKSFFVNDSRTNSSITKEVHFTHFVIIVPIFTTWIISLPLDMIIYTILFPFLTLSFLALTRLLKLSAEFWKPLTIFQILVGIGTNEVPTRLAERIFLVSLLFSSMTYSADMYSKLVDVKKMKIEVPFYTLKEIMNSELIVRTSVSTYHRLHSDGSDDILELFRKTKTVDTTDECIKDLLRTRGTACLTFYDMGKYIANLYKDAHGYPMMKIAEPAILEDRVFFEFPQDSPFINKFNELVQHVWESGVTFSMDYKRTFIDTESIEKSLTDSEDLIIKELAIILAIGYLIASVAFAVELLKKNVTFGISKRKVKRIIVS